MKTKIKKNTQAKKTKPNMKSKKTKNQKKKLDNIHENISGDYYDDSIASNPIKRVFHHYRFKNIGNMLNKRGKNLLDIGCAGGTFTNELSRHTKAKITAIDISPQAISYASAKFPHIEFQVHDADEEQFPFPDNSFDSVTMLETLEHVLNPVEILQDIRRVVKDDGEVIILVPSESWHFRLGWEVWTRLPGNIGGGVWDDSHVQAFDGHKLRHLMEFIGYEILEEKWFNLGLLVAVKARPKNPNINYY